MNRDPRSIPPIARTTDGDPPRITKVVSRADRDRLPVALETASARNVALYARFGFETVVSEEVTGGGPRFWVLRRAPR